MCTEIANERGFAAGDRSPEWPGTGHDLFMVDELVAQLQRSTDRFTDGLAAMSADAFVLRPGPGLWSASEITEHLTIANLGIHARLSKGLKALASPVDLADDEFPYLFYRGDEPPNAAAPSGSWTDADDATGQFAASIEALIAWRTASDLDLRAFGAPHPVFGVFDAHQWLLFAQAHTERHRAQDLGLARR
jgi:hypothetical protein